MSFYNMLHGVNPLTGVLLGLVGVPLGAIPRFRDTYLAEKDGLVYVGVYTRTGGGNREDYVEENDALCALPTYAYDEDDDFDCTYATFWFRVPDDTQAQIREFFNPADGTPTNRFRSLIEKLEQSPPGEWDRDPEVCRAVTVMAPLMDQIRNVIADGPPEEPEP